MPSLTVWTQAKSIALGLFTAACLFAPIEAEALGAAGAAGGGGGGGGAAGPTGGGAAGARSKGGGPSVGGGGARGGAGGGAPISAPLGGGAAANVGAGAAGNLGGGAGLSRGASPLSGGTGSSSIGSSKALGTTPSQLGAAPRGAAANNPKATATIPTQLGTARTPSGPAQFSQVGMVNGTIVPNANGVGFMGQFGSPPPWMGTGPASNLNLNAPFQPSSDIMGGLITQTPFTPPPPLYPAPQASFDWATCAQGLLQNISAQSQMSQMQLLADQANETRGPRRHQSFNRGTNREILQGFTDSEASCQKFIDKKSGEIDSWGEQLLECMHWPQNRGVYGYSNGDANAEGNGIVPTDIRHYCPQFESMSQARRDRFWVWFFMSVAGPESSCQPGAIGQGPNGQAIGLFQLEADKCNAVGVPVSSSDLMRPLPNIRCACSRFAWEMKQRDTIFIGTSRGRAGTYWGTLRSDRSHAADGKANAQTQRTLAAYPDCYRQVSAVTPQSETQ